MARQHLSRPIPKPTQNAVQGVSKSPVSKGDQSDVTPRPETSPTLQQLVEELHTIRIGLGIVRWIGNAAVNKLATLAKPDAQSTLSNKQWQKLIALHGTLIHNHISYFLEHLRIYFPVRLDDHYSMMALVCENIPAFENIWIECLEDLGGGDGFRWYHFARRWTRDASPWYSNASDKARTTGRLYHIVAILVKSNPLQQLSYYPKSLSAIDVSVSRFGHYARAVRRRLERLVAKLLRRKDQALSAAIAIMIGNLRVANAFPLNTMPLNATPSEKNISGFINYWKCLWDQFRDQYSGPLVMNTIWAAFLTSLYFLITFCDNRTWKETGLLSIAMWCISGPSFFLGMGDWLSGWQLALLWFFNAKLNFDLLEQKLSEFPRTRDRTSFCIITIGFLSAGTLSQYMVLPEGRYTNHWILTVMLAPFMTLVFTHTWSVFLGNTGIAQDLESGTYDGPTARIWQHIILVSQRVLLAIVALVLLRLIML
ncbi:uncharacterized protein BP5553_10215 [Venustampulla echinocandica]|uniref:Uncharacterized protein n=1 Tax=Venustampulla echinocandica TaxID=2656787 RepID=A0A370T9J6_9HELO|nr:uncharacterized protein BP5553_10215 [Venustampulla echinocandica]RDL30337.1 hypothetical protein BP5553_10215 [Venustampulla echinocandica]